MRDTREHVLRVEEFKQERELSYVIDDFCGHSSLEKELFEAKTPLLKNPDEDIERLIADDMNEQDWLDAADHALKMKKYLFAAIEFCAVACIIFKNGYSNFCIFFQMAAECFELAGRYVDGAHYYLKAQNKVSAADAYLKAARSCVQLGVIYAKNSAIDGRSKRPLLFFKNSFPNKGENMYVEKVLHNHEAGEYIRRALDCIDVHISLDTIKSSLSSQNPAYQKIQEQLDHHQLICI